MVNENIELFVNELVIINWNWECDLKFSFIYKIWFVFCCEVKYLNILDVDFKFKIKCLFKFY